jgi:hypothetical protein
MYIIMITILGIAIVGINEFNFSCLSNDRYSFHRSLALHTL